MQQKNKKAKQTLPFYLQFFATRKPIAKYKMLLPSKHCVGGFAHGG